MDSTHFDITIELIEPMLGGVAHNKEVYSKFIASKAAKLELAEEEIETVQSLEERGWTGFHKDDKGSFIYNYVIKGFLCESARTLKTWGAMKQLQDKFKRYVFVNPRRIYLPEEPTECLERPLRAQTAQGPRVSVVKSDLIKAGSQLSFSVEVIEAGGVTEKLLREVLSYGSRLGLGQWRSGSYGQFNVISFEEQKGSKSKVEITELEEE